MTSRATNATVENTKDFVRIVPPFRTLMFEILLSNPVYFDSSFEICRPYNFILIFSQVLIQMTGIINSQIHVSLEFRALHPFT